MRKVLIIDTSILCVWLEVPNMETCGKDLDKWDKQRVDQVLQKEEDNKTTFVLPLATIIETGNHIAQAASKTRHEKAQNLANVIKLAADGNTPWAVFSEQLDMLWNREEMKKLAIEWPPLAAQKISIGDATIKKIAEYYYARNCIVEILTGDAGLKAYEPSTPQPKSKKSQRRRSES